MLVRAILCLAVFAAIVAFVLTSPGPDDVARVLRDAGTTTTTQAK